MYPLARYFLRNRHWSFPVLISSSYILMFLLLEKVSRFSETYPMVHGWYPAAGLSFAFVLWLGPAYALVVAGATAVVDLWIHPLQGGAGYVPLSICGVGMVYGAASYLVGRSSAESVNDLRSSLSFGRFLLVALLTSAALSLVSASNLLVSGRLDWQDFTKAVLDGSIGRAAGILSLAPFLLLNVIPVAEPLMGSISGKRKYRQSKGSIRLQSWPIAGCVIFGLVAVWILSSGGLDERLLTFWLLSLPLIWLSLVAGIESVSVASLGLSFGAAGILYMVGIEPREIAGLQLQVLTSSLLAMFIGSAVSETKLMEKASSYRDSVSACVSKSVEKLIARDDWKKGLTEILEGLGAASEASHVCLVERERIENPTGLEESLLQWVSPEFLIDAHQLRVLGLLSAHQLHVRVAELSEESIVHYRREELSEEDRGAFSALGLRSSIAIPIILERQLWGCLGFDRSLRQGDWFDAEIQALKSAVRGLGTVLAQAKTEGQFRDLAGNIRAIFWKSDPTGQQRTYVSPAYEQVWGRSLSELRKRPEDWKESIHFEDLSAVEAGLSRKGEFDLEYRIILPDRSSRWIRDRGFPIRNESGQIVRMVGIAEDLSLQKEAEEKIRSTTLLLTTLIDNLGSGILVEDDSRRVHHVNQAFCELFDIPVPKESLLGTDSRLLVPRSEEFASRIDAIRTGREAFNGEELRYRNLILSRDYVPLSVNYQDNYHLWQYHNITEAKEAERQIKASLSEKEVLLQEIHHRVKNNLQIICSLLSLQSRKIQDRDVLQIFADSQNRVKAMALVHERLYKSQDLSRVDFCGYTRNLTDHLIASYRADSQSISLNLDMESVPMNINTAVPCGLIINELVSNSLKYAFDGKPEGLISVSLSQDNALQLRLVVKDDGLGLPEGFDLENAETLGLKLVKGLTEQIGGTISFKNKNGTEFDILFPLDSQNPEKGSNSGECTNINC